MKLKTNLHLILGVSQPDNMNAGTVIFLTSRCSLASSGMVCCGSKEVYTLEAILYVHHINKIDYIFFLHRSWHGPCF